MHCATNDWRFIMKNKRQIVLVVMDGVGLNDNEYGNAVKSAYTPTLDYLMRTCPNIAIKAHGTAVGLPSDEDMGNNTGEVTYQGESADWNYHQDGSSEAYRIYVECWGATDCLDQDENGDYYAKSCETCGKCC